MARFETIVTNSYHGVYWGTLLNRRVICIPFKSGLYTFNHQPTYALGDFAKIKIDEIPKYPMALDECRGANVDYFNLITSKYDLQG